MKFKTEQTISHKNGYAILLISGEYCEMPTAGDPSYKAIGVDDAECIESEGLSEEDINTIIHGVMTGDIQVEIESDGDDY